MAMEIGQINMQKVNQQHNSRLNMSLRGGWLLLLFCLCLLFNQIASAQEQPARVNEDISKVKLQAVLTPPYVLGPGDQLVITDRTLRELFGLVERYDVIISSDGYISIPLPDGKQENILTAGLTLDELSEEVRERFSKTLRNPLVFVQILRYRPINVYIGGEVVKPGVYKIETSIASDIVPLTQAIQLAGGLKPRADITKITVTRGATLEKKVIDIKALLTGSISFSDISLQPGDTIYVNPAEKNEDQAQSNVYLLGKLAFQDVPVNVIGKVGSPGSYTLSNDSTLVDALGKAGGISDVGTLKKVNLFRYDENGIYKKLDINVQELLEKGTTLDQIALRPNDTIEVEVSKVKATSKFFRETGKLIIPLATQNFGQFLIQDNFVNRFSRPQKPLKGFSSNPSTSSPITIIGGP